MRRREVALRVTKVVREIWAAAETSAGLVVAGEVLAETLVAAEEVAVGQVAQAIRAAEVTQAADTREPEEAGKGRVG